MVTGLGLDVVGHRQGGRTEEVHVHIAGPQKLAVLEVVVLKVIQAVAHVVLATQEFLFPEHLAVSPDPAGTDQVARQLAHAQFRAIRAVTQFGVRQVQVVATLHYMVGKLVAQGKAQAIGRAVFTDHVKAGQLGLFAGVFGKFGGLERVVGTHHDRAIALVEPFRLCTHGARFRAAAIDTPLEHARGVGEGGTVVDLLLVHLVAGRGAAQMGQPRAADQAVGRVFVIQWRQHPASLQ
ncbi:hypothetical protein D9M71_517260 [compost metagenome]